MDNKLRRILDHNFGIIDWKFKDLEGGIWKNTLLIQDHEKAIKTMQHTLRCRKSFNRNMKFLAVIVVAYTIISDIDRREQNRKIKGLSEEIEELRRLEGE